MWFVVMADGVKSYNVAAKREHMYEVTNLTNIFDEFS